MFTLKLPALFLKEQCLTFFFELVKIGRDYKIPDYYKHKGLVHIVLLYKIRFKKLNLKLLILIYFHG